MTVAMTPSTSIALKDSDHGLLGWLVLLFVSYFLQQWLPPTYVLTIVRVSFPIASCVGNKVVASILVTAHSRSVGANLVCCCCVAIPSLCILTEALYENDFSSRFS